MADTGWHKKFSVYSREFVHRHRLIKVMWGTQKFSIVCLLLTGLYVDFRKYNVITFIHGSCKPDSAIQKYQVSYFLIMY